MDPRESAPVMPGCLAWLALAATFILTGDWIDSIDKARTHPRILIGLAVVTVVCAVWLSTEAQRNVWLAVPLALIACVIASAALIGAAEGLLRVHVVEFSVLGRTLGLGSGVVLLLPVVFVLMILISMLFGIGMLIFKRK